MTTSQADQRVVPPLFRRGKVRDTYDLGEHLLMVASDRVSAFDVILPTLIPGKGRVLNELSRFWFQHLSGLVPNHHVDQGADDLARERPDLRPFLDSVKTQAMVVRKADRIDIECVVRGYLYGSVWSEYERDGSVAGHTLPVGLPLAAKLPSPIFSPALKVDDGHDINVAPADVSEAIGADLAADLERLSLALYDVASEYAAERGVILADTKFEFGLIDGVVTLIDEALTPDSSRYWDLETYRPGEHPGSFDKQFVRNWLAESAWNRQPPAPELPIDVVEGTQARYSEVFRRLTGDGVGRGHSK